LSLLVLAPSAHAASSVEVSAALSERRVSVGEVVTLEVTAVATFNGDIEIEVPEIEALTVLNKSQSESTSISWTGAGQTVRHERTLRIEFEAEKPGAITIANIVAHAGHDSAKAAPVSLEVVGSAASKEGDPNAPMARAGEVAPPTQEEQKLFVRYRADRSEAYVGEQIVLDLEVFTAANFNLEEMKPPPTLDGFWREIIDQPNRLTGRTERVAGREYHVFRLWRIALFGLEPGTRILPPMPLSFSMNRSIFSVGQRLRRSAPAMKLEIKPLPAEGRPKDFAAANVGELQLSSKVGEATVPAGKAVLLQIEVSGAGNIKSLKLPELGAIEGFRAFPPTVKDEVSPDSSGIRGAKRAEILLMPTKGGRLEIPPLELSIFRPSTKVYERLRTESIRIAVQGEVPSNEATPVASGPRDREAPGDKKLGLHPIRYRSELKDRGEEHRQVRLLEAALLAPPALYGLLLALEGALARMRRETPASKRRRALRGAKQRLSRAEAHARAGDAGKVYTEISEVLLAYASEQSGVALRGLMLGEAAAELLARGAKSDLVERWKRELERADYARFAPSSNAAQAATAAIENARAILSELEAWSPKKEAA
jgi:hypothetical protein